MSESHLTVNKMLNTNPEALLVLNAYIFASVDELPLVGIVNATVLHYKAALPLLETLVNQGVLEKQAATYSLTKLGRILANEYAESLKNASFNLIRENN